MRVPLRAIPRASAVSLLLALGIFAACSDSRDAGVISGPRTANIEAADLGTEIDGLIQQLYTGGHRTSVAARWENVKRQSMRNLSGRTQHVRLVQWIQDNAKHITPAGGEDQEHAAARLALLTSLYLYGGPDTEVPEVTPQTDVTLEIVQPTETDTAVTPSEQAAVIMPEGAVDEPTVIVIHRVEEHFAENCSGPLPTTLCQYPQFYKFDVFPDVPLNKPATVAVCHVNHGEHRTPLAEHDRFRVAHEAPTDPAGRHPDGVIVEGIEILPLVSVGTLVECEDNDYPPVASLSPDAGPMERLASRARWGIGYVANAIGRALTPRSLYAIDRGGGGELFLFSHFGTVDPQSRPDVAPSGFSLSSTRAQQGGAISINEWEIANPGTAAAVHVGGRILLATDTALSEGAILLDSIATVNALPPGHPEVVAARAVTIPVGLENGRYFLGVRLVHGGVHAESDASNNFVSAAINIGGDPTSLFCPTAETGAYADLREAIVNTVAGGTVFVCDGTHDVDTVVIDKPLTLTSQNPGGNAWLGDGDQSAQGTQGGRPAIIIDGYTQGTVRIEDLGFRMKGRAVQVSRPAVSQDEGATFTHPGRWDHVEIHNARFVGRNSDFGIGVQVWQHGAGVGRIDITNSHFDALGIGVFVTSHSEANVSHSTFENFTAGSVTYSGFTGGGAAGAAAWKLAFGRVEDNLIRNCGVAGCMRMVLMANGTIARNTIQAGNEATHAFGILVRRPPETPHARQPITIEDNVISGGAFGEGWAVGNGLQFEDAPGVASVIRRNQVFGSNVGMTFIGSAVVTDNKITGGEFGFRQFGPEGVEVVANRNDVVGQPTSFTVPFNRTGDYRCNWWGSENGPSNPPPQGEYAPWATQPIAGTTNPCDPKISLATVRACQASPIGGSPWNAGSVGVAYHAVDEGGTVEICNETHVVQDLHLTKSATFRGIGTGLPTLDAQGAFSVFRSFNAPVNIGVSKLRLQGATEHTIHVNGIQSLTVEHSEIRPFETHAYQASQENYQESHMSGIGAFGDVGTVTVDSTTFLGGDIGIHVNVGCCTQDGLGSGNVLVRNSTFTGQTNAGVFTGGGSAEYTLRVENSAFQQCGRMGCTKFFAGNGGNVQYVDNRFNVALTRPVRDVINVFMVEAGTTVIAGNQITGEGSTDGEPLQSSTYPIDGAAVRFTGGSVDVSGNTITNAFKAMDLLPGSLTGQDNVVSQVGFVLAGGPRSNNTVVWQRNDVTNFAVFLPGTGGFESVDMKCNWWGSTDGPPSSQFEVPPSVYTPWATQPIANTSVACDPNGP